eukprot:TRINITY_DN70419_c0_g1_i1.p2 TRINITY_DN70419_c0_g1~~TRINITY_DN70419_c0_g1_i1.p2  ORF type:complete len:134 (+),score=26.15 TRINITY_DN70419_c0_g1_i1:140-541(+)
MTDAGSDKAFPKATSKDEKTILDLVSSARTNNLLKRGANEATKSLNRNLSELIIMAADTTPIEIVLHLPLLCEDKNVQYVFVSSKSLLGRACGVGRNVVACSIVATKNRDQHPLRAQVDGVKARVDKLLMASD